MNTNYHYHYLQKTNSIPALEGLINEAAREISENAVRRAVANFNRIVHLCICTYTLYIYICKYIYLQYVSLIIDVVISTTKKSIPSVVQ